MQTFRRVCLHNAIRARIYQQNTLPYLRNRLLRFNLFEFVSAARVTEELSSFSIKKDYFSSVVIMDFPPVSQKPVKDSSGYTSLLQTGVCMVCKRGVHVGSCGVL